MNLPQDEVARWAYLRWVQRGCPQNSQLSDWLEAEEELLQLGGLARQLLDPGPPQTSLLLRALLDNSPAVIYVKDATGRYLLINRRYHVIFGLTEAEVIGRTDHEIFIPEIARALRQNDLQVLAAAGALEFEEVVPQGDGLHTYISLKFPLCSSNGTPYAVCGISTDISERIEAQRLQFAEHAVTRALAEAGSLQEAGAAVLTTVCSALGWDIGVMWEVMPTTQALGCVEIWDPGASLFADALRGLHVPRGIGPAGRAWAEGRPVFVANLAAEPDCPCRAAALTHHLHGACAFPLRSNGRILGVMELFTRRSRLPARQTEMLTSVAAQVGQFIDRRLAERALIQHERDLGIARKIQQGLLPRTAPRLPGYAIAGATHPAQETGGDYFDFIPLDDGSLLFAVGDASGHGIGAALLMAETHAYLRARIATDPDLGTVMTLVNQHLVESVSGDHFITLLLARLDPQTRTLTYASAGHQPGYILDSDGKVRTVLGGTTIPLGIDRHFEVSRMRTASLAPGDLLLLLTDGVVEALTQPFDTFGLTRTLDVVRRHRDDPPEVILTSLFRAVEAFSLGSQHDDMTAVVIQVAAAG